MEKYYRVRFYTQQNNERTHYVVDVCAKTKAEALTIARNDWSNDARRFGITAEAVADGDSIYGGLTKLRGEKE